MFSPNLAVENVTNEESSSLEANGNAGSIQTLTTHALLI